MPHANGTDRVRIYVLVMIFWRKQFVVWTTCESCAAFLGVEFFGAVIKVANTEASWHIRLRVDQGNVRDSDRHLLREPTTLWVAL